MLDGGGGAYPGGIGIIPVVAGGGGYSVLGATGVAFAPEALRGACDGRGCAPMRSLDESGRNPCWR